MDDRFTSALDLHRQGRLSEAAAAYEALLLDDPGHTEALYHLSLLRSAQGQPEKALAYALRATAAAPQSARMHAQAGGLLAVLYRPDEAMTHLERALELDPGRADVTNNIGAVLRAMGRLDEARCYFERAVALDPGYRDALRNLGNALSSAGRYAEAIGFFRRLISEGTETAAIDDELGTALWKIGRAEEAEHALRRATEMDAGFPSAWGHLGSLLVEQGRLDEAECALRRAIAAAPRRAEFYGPLAAVNPSAISPQDVSLLEELARGELPTLDCIDVHFALGKIADAAGNRRRSFEHYLVANARRRELLEYDEAATLRSFEDIAGVFSMSFMAARRGLGNASDLPVFIVGMPRSGTTLIEQLLASHPSVYGAGELDDFEAVVKDVLGTDAPTASERFATDAAALRAIGDLYVERVRALAPATAMRVTDKMPDNFKYAGLIHIALPNARIIHACRDPIDTCLSCFANAFAADGLAWTYDLGEIGRRYRGYARLMEHWRSVLPPLTVLDVRYEELVGDFETQARRIVEYCGLPWDDRVLAFYDTKRSVRTASATQVRRPIYRTSVGRACGIEDLIAPLRGALDGHG